MKVVYIAGAFRGKTAWNVRLNTHKAECVGMQVAEMGAIPLIPHSMYEHFDRTLNDQYWLTATQELLRRCDAIVLLQGWQDSLGSVAEKMVAEEEGIPVFDLTYTRHLEELKTYINAKDDEICYPTQV